MHIKYARKPSKIGKQKKMQKESKNEKVKFQENAVK